VRRIGVLMPYTKDNPEDQQRVAAFQDGLKRLGWIEGRNIQSEYRWYAGDADRARLLAKELVALKPDVILTGASPGLTALKQETRSIPLVFVAVTDPVGLGLVDSLARPGGNATGFTFFEFSVGTKLLEALQQIAPRVRRIALMYTPASPVYRQFLGPIDAIVPSTPMTFIKMPVRDASEIEAMIKSMGREPDGGLMVLPEPFFPVHQKLMVELAARYSLPTISISLIHS
jgi:putative ABC transport system substrate-binding protein